MDEDDAAAALVRAFRERGWTLASAESVTGGLVGALMTGVPGASEVFAGGVIAYSEAAKAALLGVSESTLRGEGAVSAACAREMARGARERFGATVAVATTGVAGPAPARGAPPGVVFLALASSTGEVATELRLAGDRAAVREAAARAALRLAWEHARRG